MGLSSTNTPLTRSVQSTRSNILMVSLSRFFSAKENIERLVSFVEPHTSRANYPHFLSLRLIDWFVTNYSKTHNVIIARPHGGFVTYFNVYLNYRIQLKAYSKQQFDPFRRRDRIVFHYDVEKSVETTVGQLNFFRWMLDNGVLDYVEAHATDIEMDMLAAHEQRVVDATNTTNAKVSGTSNPQSPIMNPCTSPKCSTSGQTASSSSVMKMNRVFGDCIVSFE
jgi:hypothetical protein